MANFSAGASCFLSSPYLERILAPNPTTERGRGLQINVHPTLPLLIYPSGKFIVVKNYENPNECFIYRGHAYPCTVAKFSPNGFWVASADTSGKVRIWSWDNPEHILKLELPVFAAPVCDLDWDNESKKIVATGDGSGVLVKCFSWDTGNSAGEMLGHNKKVLSVAYRPARPFRIMSGGEDMRCLFFAGPPFKLDHSNPTHTNFVNVVRYSSTGDKVVSVGSDKKIQLYDGTTGEPTISVTNAHEGGIYGTAFNPDGTLLVTASADKTLKVWDAANLTPMTTLNLTADPQLGDAQVAVNWQGENILSVSLNGNINVNNGVSAVDGPSRVIMSHSTSITSLAIDITSDMIYTGSLEGVVLARDLSGDNVGMKVVGQDRKNPAGAAHNGKIIGITVIDDMIISVGWDDQLRFATASTRSYIGEIALIGQPVSLTRAVNSDLLLVITLQEIAVFRGQDKVLTLSVSSLKYTPTCGAMYEDEEVCIGGSDNKTHVYHVTSGFSSLEEIQVIETRTAVSAVSYAPAGDLVAIGDAGRQIEVYERGTWTPRIKGKWVYHTSKITTLSWAPSGLFLASGSLDENIYVWNLMKPLSKVHIPLTHMGGVTAVQWASEEKLLSTGNDHTTLIWKIPLPTA